MTKARRHKVEQVVPSAPDAKNPEIVETVSMAGLLAQKGGWQAKLQNLPGAKKEPEKVFWHVEVLPPDPCH